jgi:hypothetical protein
MPVTPVPITSTDLDLATGAFVTDVLAAGGVTLSADQTSILASLVTAASREIIRYCGNRPFAATSFTEIVTPEGSRYDRGEPAAVTLRRFPVISITRCATGRTGVLAIANTASTTDEASVSLVATGDADFDNLTYTGLSLSRTVAGTVTTNMVSWTTTSPYTTIGAVATAINLLGGGWTAATVSSGSPDLSRLPAAYLVGAREPKDALGVGGATLDVFGTSYTGYSIDRSTGILRCNGWGSSGRYAGWDSGWGDEGDYGGPQLQVVYRAGFATVPEQLQLACAEAVQLMLARLTQDPSLKSETTGAYSWTARDALGSLSEGSMATLSHFRDWKV